MLGLTARRREGKIRECARLRSQNRERGRLCTVMPTVITTDYRLRLTLAEQ